MNCNITIAGHDYSVEFDYDITAHGTPDGWIEPGGPPRLAFSSPLPVIRLLSWAAPLPIAPQGPAACATPSI